MRLFYFAGFDIGASEDGRGQHVEGVVRGLHKLGWDVILISCKDDGDAIQPVFPFENILIRRKNQHLEHQLSDQVKLAWKLLFWKKPKPDVVYIRNRFSLLVPVIYARINKIPYFYEINGLKEFETKFQVLLKLAKIIEDWVLRNSAGIIPVTVELRDYFAQRSGLDLGRFEVIHNGADPNIWTGQENPLVPKPDGSQVIGFIGHFAPRQGLETVLRALPRIREELGDVRLVAAGTGSEKPLYERIIDELGLSEYVTFPGYVSKDKLGSLMAGFDIAIAPYTSEFAKTGTGLSPLKMFTYLACERIVVTSALEGLGDFRECPAVFFAEPDSVEDFSEKIVHVLKLNSQKRMELGKKARQYILEGFTWDKVAIDTADFIVKNIKK
jgi:glycosyltransferase involved in cell wall biosynthesis